MPPPVEKMTEVTTPATLGRTGAVTPLKLIALFGGLVLGLHALLWTFVGRSVMEPYQVWLAGLTTDLIRFSGIAATHARDVYILLPGARWEMSAECTAINAMVVFVSFILVYPAALKSKGIGLVLGIALLFAANLLRLLGLAWATHLFPTTAEFMHDYVWQVAFLFLVILLWFAWLEMVVTREKQAPLPR